VKLNGMQPDGKVIYSMNESFTLSQY